MCDAGGREPSSSKTVNPCPVDTASLAATPKRPIPVPFYLIAESRHCDDVAWHGVVGEVPSHHAGQPLALLGDRLMPPSLQLVFDLLEFGATSEISGVRLVALVAELRVLPGRSPSIRTGLFSSWRLTGSAPPLDSAAASLSGSSLASSVTVIRGMDLFCAGRVGLSSYTSPSGPGVSCRGGRAVLKMHVVREGGHGYYVDDLVPGRAEGTLVAGEARGAWSGNGAASLGLRGPVEAGGLRRLARRVRPGLGHGVALSPG
jgi:hypothetical protein